jgi:hypothetical protein
LQEEGGDRRVRRLPIFHPWSFDDFHIIQDNMAGGNRTTRDRLVPYCMFTDPPLARVKRATPGHGVVGLYAERELPNQSRFPS